MNSPADLVGRASTQRSGGGPLAEQFASWWSARDVRAHEVLDLLAERAGRDAVAMEALLALVDRHGIARAPLYRSLIDERDVHDAAQATLAVVALKIDRFDGRSRFLTWLTQVAQNEAKMLLRARSRRPTTAVSSPDVPPYLARLSTLLADRDAVARALDSLDDSFRRPLELREFDGLDYDEIATMLDVPIGTVRSRLSRGRALLAEALRCELGAEDEA